MAGRFERMMSAVAEGWTDAQIAAHFGTSKATARAYIMVYHEKPKETTKPEPHTSFEGLAGMIVSKPRGFYSDENERSFIVRAYIAGHSMERIARSLGRSSYMVRMTLKRAGIELRPRWDNGGNDNA